MQSTAPAGFYPIDDSGDNFRYWDGEKWLETMPEFEKAGVVVRAPRPINRTLHLVLTILTLGMWLPVWTIIVLMRVSDELS